MFDVQIVKAGVKLKKISDFMYGGVELTTDKLREIDILTNQRINLIDRNVEWVFQRNYKPTFFMVSGGHKSVSCINFTECLDEALYLVKDVGIKINNTAWDYIGVSNGKWRVNLSKDKFHVEEYNYSLPLAIVIAWNRLWEMENG